MPETNSPVTTPPCPHCGHALTRAYEGDSADGWWECDGCGREWEDHILARTQAHRAAHTSAPTSSAADQQVGGVQGGQGGTA